MEGDPGKDVAAIQSVSTYVFCIQSRRTQGVTEMKNAISLGRTTKVQSHQVQNTVLLNHLMVKFLALFFDVIV
jgi:hypothetical protein